MNHSRREVGRTPGNAISLVASAGVPRLHSLPLDGYVEPSTAGEDENENDLRSEVEALRSAAARGELPTPARPLVQLRPRRRVEDEPTGEPGMLWRLARDCMEELGALGMLRHCTPGDRWTAGIARLDERILADLDALVALGRDGRIRVPRLLTAWALDEPAPDSMRAYARAFVLGCLEGGGPLAVRALARSRTETLDAQCWALALASDGEIDAPLEELCTGGESARVTAALRIMALRRRADIGVVVPLLPHLDEGVRAAAVRCLGVVSEAEGARAHLEELVLGELDDGVVAEVLTTMSMLSPARAAPVVRDRLDGELARPGELSRDARRRLSSLLGVVGGPEDTARLESLMAVEPAAATAAGALGHPDPLPRLNALLDAEDAEVRTEAAEAMHRITGLNVVDPESDAISVDRTRWQTALDGWEAPSGRMRYGRAYTLPIALEELREPGLRTRSRELLRLEIAAREGIVLPDVNDWVDRQQREIDALATDASDAELGWLT